MKFLFACDLYGQQVLELLGDWEPWVKLPRPNTLKMNPVDLSSTPEEVDVCEFLRCLAEPIVYSTCVRHPPK